MKRNPKSLRALRAACVERSGGFCECGCGWGFGIGAELTPELDHFYGRARAESLETCWLITRMCHAWKTQNMPTRQRWDEKFAAHCAKHNYPFRPRLTKSLPSTPAAMRTPPSSQKPGVGGSQKQPRAAHTKAVRGSNV